ncbi:acyl-CoA dehydrogenase family protein [Solimonas marina]|uniref:Acyl-CoA dehydrogenase n=1 Tax=Solimonas marina TaxID=2714601 RepID=A0A969WDE1_9GAMM|nr:acyl-CoA dehydrogenase family protein [Solimonas marina]NKF24025.1 acyl-CoA dehydrogenase [Solimonas marina]
MSVVDRFTGIGLRWVNQIAGAPILDRLGLRRPTEQALYHGTRIGFRSAAAAARGFKRVQTLGQPARPSSPSTSGLFDLTPSEDQQMLQDAARRFADEALRPAAAAADAAGAADATLLEGAAELGLGVLNIPESLGGAGSERSAVANALVAEALAYGDMALAVAALAPSAVSNALVLWGDATQQASYLPAFVNEHAPMAALALHEPQVLFDPFALQTQARRDGADYVLSGVKSLVPRAAAAELFVVAAALDDGEPALFIVESSEAGLSIEAEPAMGLRAAETARLHLDALRVPASARLTHDAAAYRDAVALSRVAWAALASGTAQAALDYLIPYVNERTAFGEPISHRQSVAFAVADISIELSGLRLTMLRAASRAERGVDFLREAALARRLAADKGARIGSEAVQLLGGHGFVKEHPVERWYRDLRAAGVVEGMLLI